MSVGTPEVTVVRFNSPAMTWEDIMADRIARGLERQPGRLIKALAKVKAAKVQVPPAAPGIDPRDPRNDRPHTVPAYAGPAPKSRAGAAKIRRESMKACGCRLCALALRPPLTFAEQEAFCGPSLLTHEEHLISAFGGYRRVSTHEDNRDRDSIKASAAAREWELARYGPGGMTGR